MSPELVARNLFGAAIILAAMLTLACSDESADLPTLADASESDALADVSTDTPANCDADPDNDGLTNCEEATLCGGSGSRPDKKDTDGDGLNDYEEATQGTNPCKADTDGDGVDDDKELDFGFDPTDSDTHDNGEPDGEFWIFDACNQFGPKSIAIESNQTGNWAIALDPSVDYTPLQLTGASPKVAAAALDHPEHPVAGFIKSYKTPMERDQFSDWFRQELTAPLSDMADEEYRNVLSREPRQGVARTASFEISRSDSISVADFRKKVLTKLSDLSASQVNGFPAAGNQAHTTYRVVVQAIHRGDNGDDSSRPLVTAAVRPYLPSVSEALKFLVDDWTEPHNLARFGTDTSTICVGHPVMYQHPQVDVLFVVDGDGDAEYKQTARDIAREASNATNGVRIDVRLGVTNMQPANAGQLHGGEWFADPTMLVDKFDRAALDCQSTDDWSCSDDDPRGLQVARDGINYMLGRDGQNPTEGEAIRPQAQLLTIVISDEDPASLSGPASVSSFESWFRGKTTLSAVIPGDSCANPYIGDAYERISYATGGQTADLCGTDAESITQHSIMSPTITYPDSDYLPDRTPISPSIAIRADGGQGVPRRTFDGFRYFESTNRIAFFGRFKPTAWLEPGEPGFVAFAYHHFRSEPSN